MKKISDQNLYNIQRIFESKTQVHFQKAHTNYYRPRRIAVAVAAVLALCMLTAFTYPLFSPLAGDALDLSATYDGNGIVTVTVQNHSHKPLTFQPKLKLLEWITEQEIQPLSSSVSFSGGTIAPYSSGTISIDLSQAYDISALEKSPTPLWHCLVLTNQNFLFGQEWKCSVHFGPQALELPKDPGNWAYVEPQILERMEPELREYFLEEYVDIFAAYPGHYTYLQKAEEVMLRSGKHFVEPVSPFLPIADIPDGVIVDERIPADQQYTLASYGSSVQDAFGKLVSGSYDGYIRYVYAALEYTHEYQGSDYHYQWLLPILYFSTYSKDMIESDTDCALIHGQIWSFAELTPYKVYEDEEYVVFNVTSLYYTDLKAYVQHASARQIAYGSEERVITQQQYQRIENICEYYAENLQIMTREEYALLRPYCKYESDHSLPHEQFSHGLDGRITASHDMEKIAIILRNPLGEVIKEFFIIPEDPRFYDLAEATEASAYIRSLPQGSYRLDIDAWVSGAIHSHTGVMSCIFTVE